MGIVRVLVDGYSLLHHWPDLAPARERHSFQARDALVAVLTQYQDSSGTPVTVIFDGGGAPPDTAAHREISECVLPLYAHLEAKVVARVNAGGGSM